MQDDSEWPAASEPTKKSSASGFLIPLATFVLGGALAFFLGSQPPAPIVAKQPGVATFGAAAPAAQPGAAQSATAEQIALYRQINDNFVEQLRKYETRLRDIADVAEAEGAASASAAMRDFALETELIIDRYDKIAKTSQGQN